MEEPTRSDRDAAPDGALVRAAAAGHDGSFRVLVERYQTLVRGIAFAATADRALAEDLTQEAFVIAWSRLAQLRQPEKFRSWLQGITRNVVRYERRQALRRARPAHRVLDAIPELEAPDPSPLDVSEIRQQAQNAALALKSLARRHREALVLYHALDESYERLASSLDISEATARKRVSRARRKVRDQVGALEQAATSIGRKTAVAGVVLAAIQRKRAWAASSPVEALSVPAAPAGVFMTLGAVAGALLLVCAAAAVELLRGDGRAEGRAISAARADLGDTLAESPPAHATASQRDGNAVIDRSGELRAEVIMGRGRADSAGESPDSAVRSHARDSDSPTRSSAARRRTAARPVRAEDGTLVEHGPAVLMPPEPLMKPTLSLADVSDSFFFP